MKKYLQIIILLLVVASARLGVDASNIVTVDNLPKTHLQNRTLYVSDPYNILSAAATDSINSILYALEKKTGIQTVVAMAPSIGNEDSFNFAFDLLRKWKVGQQKKNNGLVILYVNDVHRIQIATGYGLEGVLPDAICKRIQQRVMIPRFKNNDIDGGMVAGVSVASKILDGSMKNDDIDDGNAPNTIELIFSIFVIVVIVIFIMRNFNNKQNGNHRNNGGSSWGGGFFIGGLGSGLGGGGGDFSGGSFGGGSGGGGGAGSSW